MAGRERSWRGWQGLISVVLALACAQAVAITCGAAGGDNRPVGECPFDEQAEPASPAGDAPASATAQSIDLVTGNKYLRHVDLVWPGGLVFSRHYNSRHAFASSLGPGWRHGWETRIVDRGPHSVQVLQGDGRRRVFRAARGEGSAGAWDSVDPLAGRIHRLSVPGAARSGWLWRLPDTTEFGFDAQGRLLFVHRPGGDRIDLAYHRHSGLLDSLRGAHGDVLRLHHDPAGRLVALEHPQGGFTRYRYDARGLLVAVVRPDGGELRYQYEDDATWHALTGVSGSGEASGAFAYDDQGRAVASRLLGHAGVRLVFNPRSDTDTRGVTEVHHEHTGVSRYRWAYLPAEHRSMILEASGRGCPVCPPVGYRASYDRHGRILLLEATHPAFTLRWSRDALGRVTRLSAKSRAPGATATQAWERELGYAGMAPDAPLASYRESSVAPGRHRERHIRRDAQGLPIEVTHRGWAPDIGSLDVAARPTRWLPVTRTLRYGWVQSSRAGAPARLAWIDGPLPGDADRVQLGHDDRGRLRTIAWPEGLRQERHFDEAGRLAGWREASGEPALVERDVRGLAVAIVRGAQRLAVTGGHRRHAGEGIDAVAALGGDSLGLPVGWPAQAAHGLEILTDPLGARTLRWRDDFGDLVAESSPLRGLVVHRRDAAGRIVLRAHDSGAIERIRYDALGRVMARGNERDPAVTRLRWQGPHLAGIVDPVRSIAWARDPDGRVLVESMTIAPVRAPIAVAGVGQAGVVGATAQAPAMVSVFTRDAHGLVSRESLPGGHHLGFTRDAKGRLDRIVFTSADGRRLTLAEAINWTDRSASADAPARSVLAGWRVGERLRVSLRHDAAGREAELAAHAATRLLVRRQLHRDTQGRIVAIDSHDTGREHFVYDTAGRLVGAAGRQGAEGFAYDANGNRTLRWSRDARDGALARVERLRHDRDGRLLTLVVDGGPATAFARSADGAWRLAMDLAAAPGAEAHGLQGTLRGSHGRPIAQFQGERLLAVHDHDASGLRVRRRSGPDPDQSVLYLHRDGLLAGEADHRGRLRRWIVRLGLRPIAELRFVAGRFSEVRWLIADQRGLPLMALDATGRVDWRATPTAFAGHGAAPGAASDDPDPGLRFAGHWADAGTGHHENGWRSYLPQLGRYAEPDPLGPLAGANERAYAGSDPIGRIDPFGLYELDVHYHLSFFLARTAGASPQRAHMVALAAQYIDDNPLTRPENAGNFAARSLYHFVMAGYDRTSDPASRFHDPRSPQLDRLLAAAHSPRASACARLIFFGEFLHTFQDSFAHRDHDNQPFRSQDGHLLAGHDPDQTYDVINSASPPGSALRAFADYRWNEARTLRMAQESWEQMRRFFGLQPALGFEALQDTVLRFARTGAERSAHWISGSRRPETQGEYTLRKLAELRDKVRVLGEALHHHGLGGFDTLYADGEGAFFQARYRAQAGAAQRDRYLAGLDHGRAGEPDPFPGILLPGD